MKVLQSIGDEIIAKVTLNMCRCCGKAPDGNRADRRRRCNYLRRSLAGRRSRKCCWGGNGGKWRHFGTARGRTGCRVRIGGRSCPSGKGIRNRADRTILDTRPSRTFRPANILNYEILTSRTKTNDVITPEQTKRRQQFCLEKGASCRVSWAIWWDHCRLTSHMREKRKKKIRLYHWSEWWSGGWRWPGRLLPTLATCRRPQIPVASNWNKWSASRRRLRLSSAAPHRKKRYKQQNFQGIYRIYNLYVIDVMSCSSFDIDNFELQYGPVGWIIVQRRRMTPVTQDVASGSCGQRKLPADNGGIGR